MFRSTFLALSAAAFLIAGATAAHAVPQILQYQGRLTDSAGEPIGNPVHVVFSIYANEDDDVPLWTQTFDHLPLDNGRFSVLLGGVDAPFTPELNAALAVGTVLYLGITVADNDEMTPRQRIVSVAYALHAQTAETVTGVPGIAFRAVTRTVVGPTGTLSVVSVTITTPVDGLVLVAGGGTLVLDNGSGGGVVCHANIGEVENAAPDTAMGLIIATIDSTDLRVRRYVPFHTERVFETTAGTHTFYLNVANQSARPTAANRPAMTATFFPINYGEPQALARPRAPAASNRGH
jgi:hypothetical protein